VKPHFRGPAGTYNMLPVPSSPPGGGTTVNNATIIREPYPGAWQQNVIAVPNTPPLLSFSAVYGCVNVISSDIAKLPINLWRKLKDGGRVLADDHPIHRLLQSPNPYQTHVDFFSYFFVSLLLAGNAYVYLTRDARGVVKRMDVLNPSFVRPLVSDVTGDVFYQIGRSTSLPLLVSEYNPERDGAIVPARYMIHHRIMCVDHPLVGVTPLYAAAMAATLGVRAAESSSQFFGNMARPAGVLTAPGKISKELADRLRAEWDANYGPGRAGRTAMLGDGLKWEAITMTAVDAQLLELLRWGIADVARVYRVPGFLLGDLDKVTYRNSETLMRTYYSGCLQYHLEALEARLDTTFDLAADVDVEFDVDAILRTDLDVRFTAYKEGIQSGFMTINEARAQEGWPGVEGGDEPMMQVQFRPLSMLDEPATPTAPTTPAAPTAPPPSDKPKPPGENPKPDATDDEEAEGIAAFVRFSDVLHEGVPHHVA
jgi:HK97 family phage portal protein